MAIEYRLTVAGTTPMGTVAARAFPDPAERPGGTSSLLVADLDEESGFEVTVYADQDGYVEAESEEGMWIWEPSPFVSMTFRMTKDGDPVRGLLPMLTAVKRVLDSGPEDVALDLNGSWLLLTRTRGVITKHMRAEWWSTHSTANSVIPS